MKQFCINLLCLVSLVCCSNLANASSSKNHQDQKTWGGSIQAGGVVNTGNSDNKNFNGKVTGSYETIRWDNTASISGELNSADGSTTAENLTVNGQAHYNLSTRDYLFAKGSAVYDKFATFDRVYREAIGYGRILYQNDTTFWSLEAGPGGSHSRIAGTHNYQNELVANIDSTFKRKISNTAAFKQTVGVDVGPLNTHTESVTAIKTKMTKNLALEISYTVEHDSQIPMGSINKVKTDTISKIAVVYDF